MRVFDQNAQYAEIIGFGYGEGPDVDLILPQEGANIEKASSFVLEKNR